MDKPAPTGANAVAASCLMVIVSIVLQDLGTAFAKTLFGKVGADGMIALRLVFAAGLLMAVQRPWRRPVARTHWPNLIAYGVLLGAGSVIAYRAFALLPLGAAVGIQTLGPLAVVVATSRRPRDFLWVALAAAGLWLLLPRPASPAALDPVGIAYAVASAACWGLYIVVGKRVAPLPGGHAVSWGMAIAGLIALPFGVASGGAALLSPGVLAAGLAVAVLASAVPYTLELIAMRSLPHKVFGILLSAAPAFASLMGFLVLGERLTAVQWAAISLIMAASAGSAATAARSPLAPAEERP